MTIGKAVGLVVALGLPACGGKVVTSESDGMGGNGGTTNTGVTNGGGGKGNGPTTSGSGGSKSTTTGSDTTGMGGAPQPGVTTVNTVSTVNTVNTATTTGGMPPPGNPTTTGGMPPSMTTGSVPPITPPDCTPLYQSVQPGWCEIELECNNRWAFAYCEGWDQDTTYCSCDSDGFYGDYQLTGVSFADACPITAGLCVGAVDLEYSDPVCEYQWGNSGPGYCSNETECVRTANVTPEITARTTEWRSSWCESTGNNTSTCECWRAERSLRFELETPLTAELCTLAHDICATGEVATSGEKSCSIAYQSAAVDWCEANLDCAQTATIGDTPVTLHSNAWTNCRRSGDTTWLCDCNDDGNYESFEIENPDTWLACQEAANVCNMLLSP